MNLQGRIPQHLLDRAEAARQKSVEISAPLAKEDYVSVRKEDLQAAIEWAEETGALLWVEGRLETPALGPAHMRLKMALMNNQ